MLNYVNRLRLITWAHIIMYGFLIYFLVELMPKFGFPTHYLLYYFIHLHKFNRKILLEHNKNVHTFAIELR